ncbi:MAG: restriction endonuclease subunit S [Erysipelotrichaceae bacterium]|nr:restriction endonuclease subunit S [Erysipelotrichaceae bacterium]
MSWEYVKLGDLYSVHNGLSKGGKFFGSGYPFLTFSTVFNNYFIPDELTDLVQSTEKEQNNYSVKRGDVFVTRTSETSDELGMSCVALKDYPHATYNGFTKRMRPLQDGRVLPEYIGYYMRMPSFRGEFQAFSTMTTRASLKNEDLLGLKVALPPIETQEKIASTLKAYDDLIKNNQKQIKLLEEAAQRLYKEWFVDLRFPGHEDVVIVDGVPEGWEKDKAERFFNITIGKTPPRAEKQWFVNGNDGVPWLSISDMGTSGVYSFTTSEGLTQEAVKKHNMKVVPAGTIFVSFKLTVGRVSIATTDMCTNEAIAHFYIDDDFKQAYTYCYLNNFEYDTLGNTSSISKAVNSKIIKAMPFVMPDEATILAFDRIVEPILKEIKNKQIVCIKLKEARDRLLPKLMNGEIEV